MSAPMNVAKPLGKIGSLSLWVLLILGCSAFNGPRSMSSGTSHSYQATGEEFRSGLNGGLRTEIQDATDSSKRGPKVVMRGARVTESPENEINFDWPVEEARLSQGFRLGKRPHWGVDLASRKGTHILAAEAGLVVYAGRGFRGYGNLIVIEHDAEWATLYSHLDKISIREGQKVTRGQFIGTMGRTGRATGVHLHFEIRQNRQPVNPLAHLPGGLGPELSEDLQDTIEE